MSEKDEGEDNVTHIHGVEVADEFDKKHRARKDSGHEVITPKAMIPASFFSPSVCEESISAPAPQVYTDIQLRPPTFWRLNEDTDLFEEIDPVTGAVVSISGDLRYMARFAEFVETEIDGVKVRVQTGVDYAHLPKSEREYVYSEALGDVIADKIMEGIPFTRMHEVKGMPSRRMLARWLNKEKGFREKISQAKRYRAEHAADEVRRLGQAAEHAMKDEIPGISLAIQTHKWSAEKDSPEDYGNKVEVKQSVSMQVVIDTGIRRIGDAGAPQIIEVQSKRVEKPEDENARSDSEEVLEQSKQDEEVLVVESKSD